MSETKKKAGRKRVSKRAATPRTGRTRVPMDVKIAVLTEAGYRCAVPTCRGILALDLHHIVQVADAGGNDLSNLLALCPTCHALFHRGEIPHESIRAWKGMLVSLSRAFDADSINLLLFADALHGPVPVSIDGLLRFANLLASGLVAIEEGCGYGDGRADQVWTHVAITARGQALLAAWKSGKRTEIAKALATS